MKARNVLYAAALIVVTSAITTQVVSQDKKDRAPGAGQPPAMTPEQQEMMKKWEAFATPGENHKLLTKKVGKWNTTVKMWEQPDQTPQESSGTSEIKSVIDGRYIAEQATGTTPWGPFEGHGLAGYDNLKRKFVATWIDNMGTGIMYSEGTYDAATKSFTYYGEAPDVMAGKYKKSRMVERWIDENTWGFEMYDKDKAGKEWKNFEITYKRAR